jgi:hypothetical protein
MKVFFFCQQCDPQRASKLIGHETCPACGEMAHYFCPATKRDGLYKNFFRHARTCDSCKMANPQQQQEKQARRAQQKAQRVQEAAAQEPWATWRTNEQLLRDHTGVGLATFELVLRSVKEQLAARHGKKVWKLGQLRLTPANQLLYLLVFLRKNPTGPDMKQFFPTESEYHVYENVKDLCEIVCPCLLPYVQPPTRVHRVIKTGVLTGAAFFTDSTDVPIPRPGAGQSADRKKYYDGKNRSWAAKVQISVGLDGKICDISDVVPGSESDRKLFEESNLPIFIAEAGLFGIGDAHYVRCEGMFGTKKGSKQSVEFADYNQTIENVRSIVENANSRLKVWKVIQGPWRHDRHDLELLTKVMRIVCALLNLEIEHGHPVRRDLSSLQPRIANPRHEKKRAKQLAYVSPLEENKEEEESEEDVAPEEEDEPMHEVADITSHRVGLQKGKPVVFYRVKFLDGDVRECTADFISPEALAWYHQHHRVPMP